MITISCMQYIITLILIKHDWVDITIYVIYKNVGKKGLEKGYKQACVVADSHQLARENCNISPNFAFSDITWQLEISHHENVDTMETSKHYKSMGPLSLKTYC